MGIFPFEDDEYCSPFIHTTDDLVGPSANSPELSKNLIQCGLAAVATLAIPYNEVGIKEQPEPGLIRQLFPNPANGEVRIGAGGNQEILFELFSVRGELLKKGNFKGNLTLDLSSLEPGPYFMKFTGKSTTETRSLIIE
jgi:hypothetical protein